MLKRLGHRGDRDDIIQGIFEAASRVTLFDHDGEPLSGDDFLVETFESLGTTRDYPACGSAEWIRLREVALRRIIARLTREGLLDCVAVSPVVDAVCGDETRQARRVMPEGEPDSPDGLVENDDANDDDGPGTALGEAEGTSLRFDAIYCAPVIVKRNGQKMTAFWPPSFGMVKLKPDGSRRSVVVALDDLDDHNRLILRAAPTRRRTKAVVMCCAKQCNRSYTAWIRTDTRIEDVEGRPINEFGVLFAARCERHREPL